MPNGPRMSSKLASAALGLALAFATVGIAAAAERYRLVNLTADKGSALFLDMGSIRRSGDIVEASSVFVFPQPRSIGGFGDVVFLSARNAYSCTNRTRTAIEVVARGADLAIIGKVAATAKDRPVAPNSIESDMLDQLCRPDPNQNIESLPSDMGALREVFQ